MCGCLLAVSNKNFMKLKFIEKKNETADAYSFVFEPEKPFSWKPGQFLFYTLPHPDVDDRGVTRYFSISAAPHEKHVMLTTRIEEKVGSSFKKKLLSLAPGNTVEASGPDGDFIVEDPNKNYIFIAGGIGVTPFRSILLDHDHQKLPINVTLLYANRDSEFPFNAEFEQIAERNKNFKIKYFISPVHIEEKDINDALPATSEPLLYISGPEPMVEAMGGKIRDMGIPEARIKEDFFPNYEEF